MKSLIFIHSLFFTFSIGSIFSEENQENEVDANRSAVIYNSSFEEGDGEKALGWAFTHSQPAVRTDSDFHTGSYSAYVNLINEGKKPSEAHIVKNIDGNLLGGLNYELSFFVKQKKKGTGGYIQQYFIEWFNEDKQIVEGTGFKQFNSTVGLWEEIIVPDIKIPESVRSVKLLFRFVTGATSGGGGEVFIDDINFRADDSPEALLTAISRNVDQAQFQIALGLINDFLNKYPTNPQNLNIKSLKARLIKFQDLEESNN